MRFVLEIHGWGCWGWRGYKGLSRFTHLLLAEILNCGGECFVEKLPVLWRLSLIDFKYYFPPACLFPKLFLTNKHDQIGYLESVFTIELFWTVVFECQGLVHGCQRSSSLEFLSCTSFIPLVFRVPEPPASQSPWNLPENRLTGLTRSLLNQRIWFNIKLKFNVVKLE